VTPDLLFPSGLDRKSPGCRLVDLMARMTDFLPDAPLPRDLEITGLCIDSREARPGSLFFAIPGARQDGAGFSADAVRRGAVAVVADRPLDLEVPVIRVKNVRRALADSACHFYRNPANGLAVTGVTGTNGKTTTVTLLRQILEVYGIPTGMLATTGYRVGDRELPASHTTPDAVRIHGYLRQMADARQRAAVMEVSSHALDQERVHGLKFTCAVITNLTQDHLDYHRSMENYRDAKLRLFRSLTPGACAVVPADDPVGERAAEVVPHGVRILRFGMEPLADVHARIRKTTFEGADLDLRTPDGEARLFLPLLGRHNIHNALAAAAAAVGQGVGTLHVVAALEKAQPARGRLEPVGSRDARVRVLVDYAHTPDALLKVCRALRPLTPGRLLVLFGCGGDRDRTKRGPMGQVVASAADLLVITSDNPRSEDPESILDAIEAGVRSAGRGCQLLRITDRRAAIARVIGLARPGDTVLIAGKGHENYQILGDTVVPFDDRAVAEECLEAES
jgi:UDP-N-acetylmuramoyl-L-alanyl-D-glutamate--2,6-diaminopimelate ligase